MKLTLTNDEVKNGAVTREFETSKLSGLYYAHVTVAPAGFECAMAMVEECTSESMEIPCAADITKFTATAIITPLVTKDLSEATGMTHSIAFSVSDLWNCDLYAKYSVQDTNGGSKAEATLKWDDLTTYVASDSTKVLESASSFYDFDYTLVLHNTSDDSVYKTKKTTDVNPSVCTVSGTMSIDVTEVSGEINVAHTYDIVQTPACEIKTVSANIFDNGESVAVVDLDAGEHEQTTTPTALPAVVFASFPIKVDSYLEVTFGDQTEKITATPDDVWPACTFSPDSVSMTESIVRDTDGVRALSFNPNWSTTVGNAAYCPDFSGVLTLKKDGEAL
jgi:hypothetical protein